jgi:hypothetical protein
LKLYQTALKYHSEGPPSYDKALDAYKELFESEIFKYPESQTELRRSEGFATLPEYEELWMQSHEAGPVQLAVPTENAPNTLPQILHLAYKNHGQFLLDLLQFKVQEHLRINSEAPLDQKKITDNARIPLEYYSEALDKDDSDVDLWRCTAAVATLVGSNRIARFCLEAVLDMGEENLDDVLGLSGVEETIALQRLQELSQSLQDDLSLMLAPLSKFRRKKLAEALRKRLESHSAIPKPTFHSTAYSMHGHLGRPPTRYVITCHRRDWAAVGDTILQQLALEQGDMIDVGPGVGVGFKIPELPAEEVPTEVAAEVEAEPPTETATESPTQDPEPMKAESPKDIEAPPQEPQDVSPPSPAEDAQPPPGIAEAPDDDVQMKDGENNQEPNTDLQENGEAENGQIEENATEGVDVAQANPDIEASEKPETVLPPSRKRSTDSAGLGEHADGGRVRSKRIRARETLDGANVEGTLIDTSKQLDDSLQKFIDADEWLFDTINTTLRKFHAEGLGSIHTLRTAVKDKENTLLDPSDALLPAIKDFYTIAENSTPDIAGTLANGFSGESIDSLGAASRDTGLNAFLGHSKSRGSQACIKPMLGPAEGLVSWLEKVNAPWTYNKDAAWQFLVALLKPGSFPEKDEDSPSSYVMHRWSDDLKRIIVQIAVRFDDHVFPLAQDMLSTINSQSLQTQSKGKEFWPSPDELYFIEMIQTLFELHLDVYSLIKHPASAVDSVTQTQQKYRLERWSTLANSAMNMRNDTREPGYDELAIRHIWATAFHISVCDDVTQNHVLACMKDLKQMLESLGEPSIQLQNNAVMPEISISAVEQELSKISMKDFFVKVFSDKDEDPVTTIESLEPLLELTIEQPKTLVNGTSNLLSETNGDVSPGHQDLQDQESPATLETLEPTPHQKMSKFLANGSWSLRISLWQRLRQAYIAIDYTPKVVSCHLRSIELLVNEVKSIAYLDSPQESRNVQLVRWLHLIGEFVRKVLRYNQTSPNAFECIDAEHLRTSTNALTSLMRILYSFNVFEDQLRVGTLPSPTFEGRPRPSFTKVSNWVHDIQLHVWMLLYTLLKEGIEQNPEAFSSPAESKFEFLRTVHYAMGIRGLCNKAKREFLHLLQGELLGLSDLENSDVELCQVLLDLYGLKCASNATDVMDHSCSDTEPLVRKTAIKLVGFLMTQAQKVPMKDLPKTDLKLAIDKLHSCLGRGKQCDDIVLNRRVYNNYIKSTIHPLDLFSCLRGDLDLPTKPIAPSDAEIAAKGWYFLMGLIALSKFRSAKRLAAGPAEDLNAAVAFFTQDLEYSTERWETWYRLAQAHDLQLEENVSWSAEKLNSHSHEVFYYQRAAIHCYAMAMACAVRCGDQSSATTLKMAEMFAEFGNRMYSSTREPFSMLAFTFREHEERWFSGQTYAAGTYKKPPFKPLTLYTAWRIAAVLFKRSLARSPNQWSNHYMLGKCRWKMYTASEEVREGQKAPSLQEVVMDCFIRAIETLPNRRDNRKEPILEPHYKLVSIVNKLVRRGDINAAAGADVLQATSYASKVILETDDDGWEQYVLNVLKNLRAADKSGWHHRMTARVRTFLLPIRTITNKSARLPMLCMMTRQIAFPLR